MATITITTVIELRDNDTPLVTLRHVERDLALVFSFPNESISRANEDARMFADAILDVDGEHAKRQMFGGIDGHGAGLRSPGTVFDRRDGLYLLLNLADVVGRFSCACRSGCGELKFAAALVV